MTFTHPKDETPIDEQHEAEEILDPEDVIELVDDDEPETEPLVLAPPPARRDVVGLDPLHIYLQEIKKFRPLEQDEEFDLARRYRDDKEEQAAFVLITSNLRLVVKIAMDFQRRWMKNVLDLIQEGNVGLMKAVQKFDPDKGIKFSYYASFWIKAYILKFIMDNWRMVKIGTTQAQRKLFYNLGKERQRLQALGYDPDTSTLSKNLQVSESDIIEMGQRLGQHDVSLDMQIGDDSSYTPMDFIPALEAGIEEQMASDEISTLIHDNIDAIRAGLNEKERDILEQRLLADSPITLREIGDKYGITRERVRQIEARLLQKIKHQMSTTIQDFSEEWIEHEN
ncbi:MAG: sigma-70 family RNA polymerase sigma factor [Deltaproteobacteria bacterium]|nr:sigma-70 family RNA polymerase sigma factor [Deltaproteobacteria bacterium]